MKRVILSLFCASLAGLAWAAEPAVVTETVPCGPKVCVPEATTKKVPRVVFEQKCVEYCLPRCSLLSFFRGDCGCGTDGACGRPRVRHALVKKIVYDEVPATKCTVAVQSPVCK